MTSRREAWERWGPQAPVGAVVWVYGLWDAWHWAGDRVSIGLVALGVAAAVGLSRRAPLAALGLAWLTGVLQVDLGAPVVGFELALVILAYGCARWGQVHTVWLSGLSIPIGAAAATVYLGTDGDQGSGLLDQPLSDLALRYPGPLLTFGVVAVAAFTVPWLAGLVVRTAARATRSRESQVAAEEQTAQAQVEAGQAQEIARLREEQARLARDVHDVVGHSLAVILAQAESAQYLPDDPQQLKATMATIAGSARTSLQDVRQVLAGPGRTSAPTRTGAFEQLLVGVRAGGHEVLATEVGSPQPLPPELEVVAHRVAQEMLTNAIRHGRRDAPVRVERHWPENGFERDLRIEVRNVVDDAPAPPGHDETQPLTAVLTDDGPPGQGLDGMRRRLDAVGGRLDVRRRDEPDGPTFTVTAWVPVSGR